MKTLILFPVLFALLLACTSTDEIKEKNTQNTNIIADTSKNEIEVLMEESQNYLNNRDLDGDGINDEILFGFSGGAHCCYNLSLKLSSLNDTLNYPFEMDGGYEFGIVDGSQPDQFNIEDVDNDGLPEIVMRISTYNAEVYPIDNAWTKKFGIKTNTILFDFKDGKMVLNDFDLKRE